MTMKATHAADAQDGGGMETMHGRPATDHSQLLHCQICSIRDRAFCGALEEPQLLRLSAMATDMKLEPPQTIVYEGDPAQSAFNVCTGVVRLTKMLPDGRRQITGFLFPGDFIGLSQKETHGCSAEAVTPVSLCRFPRKKLLSLFEEFPEAEHRLLRMAADEITAAQEQILMLGRKTAKERVASFLLMVSRQMELRGSAESTIALPMSRADIADYLGLTIETVSRTFTKLIKDGLISLTKAHEVRLENQEGLETVASGLDLDG